MDKQLLLIVFFVCFSTLSRGFVLDTGNRFTTGRGETPQFWQQQAKADLLKAVKQTKIINVAKNVILFLGDGMSIPTITAARILQGQMNGQPGEENVLSFEKFPYVGLSKTYNQDFTTPDSAATATAFLCGVKTNLGTIGVDASATRGDCLSSKGAEVTSILDWSIAAGKAVGFVTTSRVTHATPAASYANVAERNWEGDHETKDLHGACKDIASQLIDDYDAIQVILGGGRRYFMKYDQQDPEHGSNTDFGRRDGRDLIQEWQDRQRKIHRSFKYVWNSSDFNSVIPKSTDSLMGLFSSSFMNYEIERQDPNHERAGEPSLQEMTEKAIQILNRNPKGFFLLVEGGNIDMAHHFGTAKKALYDTLALQDAVAKGVELTNENETLIVVTADHSHTMSITGYPHRGNPILGKVDDGHGRYYKANDGLPYTTLMYAGGPGYSFTSHGTRTDITNIDTTAKDYQQQSAIPLDLDTHGGDDVAIYARGPMAHLLAGVHEQHYIAHVMAYASCVGEYNKTNDCARSQVSTLD